MGKLLAFRHAEAAVNRPDLFVVGQADRTYPLTDIGINQAREAGAWAVKTFDWVAEGVFAAATSEFVRAQQTYQQMRLSVCLASTLANFNEQNWGDFMGPDPPEALRPGFEKDYESSISAKPPHGEASFDLYQRVRVALSKLAIQPNADNIIIVAHGRALIALRMVVEGVPPSDAGWVYMRRHAPELPNCGALYYPNFHWSPNDEPDIRRRVAVVCPPYCTLEYFQWQPYLGDIFAVT